MSGLIHLYCGDGKGKTTCAMGLALRAAGRGMPVVIAQFLKSENSGERDSLRRLEGITLLPLPEQVTFTFCMTPEEKAEEKARSTRRFRDAARLAAEKGTCLLVLDEICAAISTGMLELSEVEEFLDGKPEGVEVVMTGRDPAQSLMDRADYITEMRKRKHPFDRGIPAREGIEY